MGGRGGEWSQTAAWDRDWSAREEWGVERGLSAALAGLAGALLLSRGLTRPPRPKTFSSAAEASGPSSALWHREGGAPRLEHRGISAET